MLKKYIYSAALALSFNTALLAYDKDLETLYPDTTMLYGRVDSIEKLSKIDPAHPIAKLFEHPAFRKYMMGLKDENEDKEELAKEAEAFIKEHCTNRASFGLLDIGIGRPNAETTNSEDSQAMALTMDPKFFSMAMTVDCTANQEEVDELLKLVKESTPEKIEAIVVEEFEGVSYSVIEQKEVEGGEDQPQDIYVALVDELLIISLQEEDIKDFIGKVKAPNKEKTLADNPKYLDAAEKLKKYDLSMFMRIDQMHKILIVDKETSLLNYLDESPQVKMFISRNAIENDLHLDAFDSAFVGALVTEEGGDLKFGFSVKSEEGIAGLFQHDKFIPELPKFAFENYKSMSVSSYDFKNNYLQMEKLFSKVSPMGFMAAKAQFPDLYKMMKANLFENLEPYLVTLGGHIDPALYEKRAASQVYVGKVKNAALIYELLDKVKEKVPTMKTQEFMGEKIYQVAGNLATGGADFYIGVVNNHLVMTMTSEDDMWRHVISQIKNPGKDIASHKALADMWDSMPKEEVSMGYQDLGQMILDSHFAEAAMMKGIGIEDENANNETGTAPDVKDLNYSIISKFYQEENSWYSYMKLKDYSPQNK